MKFWLETLWNPPGEFALGRILSGCRFPPELLQKGGSRGRRTPYNTLPIFKFQPICPFTCHYWCQNIVLEIVGENLQNCIFLKIGESSCCRRKALTLYLSIFTLNTSSVCTLYVCIHTHGWLYKTFTNNTLLKRKLPTWQTNAFWQSHSEHFGQLKPGHLY